MSHIRDATRARKVYPFRRQRPRPPGDVPRIRRIGGTAAFAATIDSDDYVVLVDNTQGGTLTLPLGTTLQSGEFFVVKDSGGGAFARNITVATQGSELIDAASTYVLKTNYESVTMLWDGTNGVWRPV